MEKFTFFYRTESPFSQWHPARFVVNDISFNCAEQYMMFRKAMLFGDKETMEKILLADSPGEQKQLGRMVRGFQKELWEAQCKSFVYDANYAKFTQNQHLLEKLLATKGTTLVEASPTDRIWGVGLLENNTAILDRKTWQGTNWLGEVLTNLRESLLAEVKHLNL
jgi:ribA/ribD-fused uncharacterized protein